MPPYCFWYSADKLTIPTPSDNYKLTAVFWDCRVGEDNRTGIGEATNSFGNLRLRGGDVKTQKRNLKKLDRSS